MFILLLLFSLTITSSRSERCFEKMRENERSSNEYEIMQNSNAGNKEKERRRYEQQIGSNRH